MTRYAEILSLIQEHISKSENKHTENASSYEYKCRKCGLILEFNRNQPDAICPRDGSTMYRIF